MRLSTRGRYAVMALAEMAAREHRGEACLEGRPVTLNDIAAAQPEENAEVLEAVWRLPERDRYIVYLYYYEELPVKEIASLLDEQTGTITSRLSRARKKLKLLLKGDGYGTISEHV